MMLRETARPPHGLGFATRIQDGFTIVTIRGDLDIACAPVLREQLLGVLGVHASGLVIDLSQVSFCDASGLSVLVGTARRARLLGGVVRLAAPAPCVAAALRVSGLGRPFDIFRSVPAALANAQAQRWVLDDSMPEPARIREPAAGLARPAEMAAAPGGDDLRGAVTALLAHAGAWRDADPNRRLTPTLRTLARAHAGADHAALVHAARSLLAALIRHPLTPSPAVAATAGDLRRFLDSGTRRPALN